MKNIAQKKNKQNTNVFNIADNPRFEPKKLGVVSSKNVPQNAELVTFTMADNSFGFAEGDTIVCRQDFNREQFTAKTLAVADVGDGLREIVFASNAANILAVIVAFQREVSQ